MAVVISNWIYHHLSLGFKVYFYDRGGAYKDIVEKTANHFVLTLGDTPSTALISMKSTQLKISRKWNTMMAQIQLKGKNGLYNPASFSHIYNLKTVQQSNDKGTWFGWEVSKVGPIQDAALYQKAKSFSESVNKGEVETKPETKETQKQFSL